MPFDLSSIDLSSVDLTNLTSGQVGATALYFGFIDTLVAIVISVAAGTFATARVGDFLRTHVLRWVAPILLLTAVGHGIPFLGIPAIPPFNLAATGALGAYLVSVAGSIVASWNSRNAADPAG